MLEDITDKKITRNGDQIIREVCEKVENENGIDVMVCNQTEKFSEEDEQ